MATALALDEDAERYLCPYKVFQDGVASFEAGQPEDQLPVNENASCKNSKDGIGDHATGSSSKHSKRIDTKSFAQVVFNTQAFQTFYGNTSSQSISINPPSAGSQPLPVQEPTDRPQTLSHFSLANLEALVKFSRTCMHMATGYDLETPFRITAPGLVPELVRSSARQSAPDALKRFVHQSLTYVLSKPANLLLSFRGEATQSTDDVPVPGFYCAPFSDIVQCFRYLKKFDEEGRKILSCLFAACSGLYSSLEHGELRVSRESRKQQDPPNDQISIQEKMCTALGEPRHRHEIVHIAQIVLAALVACTCPCSEDVFEMVEFYHDRPAEMASAGRLVQEVLDTFDNPLAHDLLAILLKVLVLRNSILWDLESVVNGAIRDAMMTAQPEPFGCLAPNGPQRLFKTIWIHSPPWPKQATEVPTPDYLSIVIQWLKYLIIRAWDGNAIIDPYGEIRGALDILQIFRKCG